MRRRNFLRTLGLGSISFIPQAHAVSPPRRIIGFTKPFQKASFERTAEIVAEVGWNGIELPLRKNGQIVPERVEEDLPRLVEALKKRDLTIELITTDIVSVDTPHAERVLRTAKALGIIRYRTGYTLYDGKASPQDTLNSLKPKVKDLAALNRSLGVRGGMQNHSGSAYVGCAVWDLFELVRDLSPADIGICFDIGHATVEGGSSWPVEARLIEPWLVFVYAKDFVWERTERGFAPKWGPFGQGMLRREFFTWLKNSTYEGPISLHVEYVEGDGPEQVARMKSDQATLRGWLE